MSADRPLITINFTDASDTERAIAALWPALETAWPAFGGIPSISPLDLDEARTLMAAALEPVLLAVLGPNTAPSDAYCLAAHLKDQQVPALLLIDDAHADLHTLAGDGVLTAPIHADPACVASTLNALALAQAPIAALKGDLNNAIRAHHGADHAFQEIQNELMLASSVQQGFLPERLPEVTGLDLGVVYRPAGYVSGDIYDVFRAGPDHIGLFVADVVGHGVPAALMTMVIARSLDQIAKQGGDVAAPADVLRSINIDLIRRQSDEPCPVTAMYAVLDLRDRCVTLAGAGHPAALVYSDDGAREFASQGGLLGIFTEDAFDQRSFTLKQHETMLIYTDGFELAFPPPNADIYEQRRPTTTYLDVFREVDQSRRAKGIVSAIASINAKLDAADGSLHQNDDVTAIVVGPAKTTALDRLFPNNAGEPRADDAEPASLATNTTPPDASNAPANDAPSFPSLPPPNVY